MQHVRDLHGRDIIHGGGGGVMTMLCMRGWEHAEMFEIHLKLFLVTFIVARTIALCPGIP